MQWCAAPARKRTFPPDTAPVYVCKTHQRWFGPKDSSSGRGFRSGYLAAAETIDNYVCGSVPMARLSDSGAFTHSCIFCGALYFQSEAIRVPTGSVSKEIFTRCCKKGAHAALPLLPDAPELLACLLTGKRPRSDSTERELLRGSLKTWPQLARHFQDNIRAYNCALGFAAYTDTHTTSTDTSSCLPSTSASAPPVYVLHGRVYHVTGTL